MKLELGTSRVGLEQDQLISMRDAAGVRVACLDGTLWITQEQRSEDVLLEPGESFVIDNPGLTLVTALRTSDLRVTETHAAGTDTWHDLAGWFGSWKGRARAAA